MCNKSDNKITTQQQQQRRQQAVPSYLCVAVAVGAIVVADVVVDYTLAPTGTGTQQLFCVRLVAARW